MKCKIEKMLLPILSQIAVLLLLTVFGLFVSAQVAFGEANHGDLALPSVPSDNIAHNVRLMGHIGGVTNAVCVTDNKAYFGEGTRLSILDVSQPDQPRRLGTTPPMGDFVQGIAVQGNFAYVAAGSAGLQIFDISSLPAPVIVGSLDTPGNAGDVYVQGIYAYVADEIGGIRIVNISDPSKPREDGVYTEGVRAYGIYVLGDYAYVANFFDLLIINITNPVNPHKEGSYITSDQNARDVFVSGKNAYVADGDAGLEIVDITIPSSPIKVGGYNVPRYAHDVYVSGNYAFVAQGDSELISNGIAIINVEDPTTPTLANSYAISGKAVGVYVANNFVYVANQEGGLSIVNATVPFTSDNAMTYNSLGAVSNIRVLAEKAYVTNSNNGVYITDVSNPSRPVEKSFYEIPGWAYDVDASGDLAYIAAGYGGLRVINITTRQELGYNDSLDDAYSIDFAGTYVYVTTVGNYSGMASGLYVVDVSNPSTPMIVGFVDTPGEAQGVFILDNYAYIADASSGIRIIDVMNAAAPKEIGFYDTLGTASGIFVSGIYIYVADGDRGLRILSNNPFSPTELGFIDTPGWASDVYVSNNYAYVADNSGGLRVINVTNPSNPIEVGFYGSEGSNVFVSGNYTYLSGSSGLSILRYPACYRLTLKLTGQGSALMTTPTSSAGCETGEYLFGTQVTLSANPAINWRITGWVGTNNDNTASPNNILTMPAADHEVTVNYVPICYALISVHTGAGSDLVTTPANSAGCPANHYVAGELINLNATPSSGWLIASWSGTVNDGSIATNNSLVMPGNNHTIGITYVPNTAVVTVQDESSNLVAGAQVHLYRGKSLVDIATTTADGRAVLLAPQANDSVIALQPFTNTAHNGWPYHLYLTSMEVPANDGPQPYVIPGPGSYNLVVKKQNPLVLFDPVISLEWCADQDFLDELTNAIHSAASFLYDVTEGQFTFGNVAIYTCGDHWQEANLQILGSNRVRPFATTGGIVSVPYDYTSSAGKASSYLHGIVRFGRSWDRYSAVVAPLDKPDAFRTLVHEWLHYAFFLQDEYFQLDENTGEIHPAHCTAPEIRDSNNDFDNPQQSINASVLYWPYNASELEMAGTANFSAACQNTQQWLVHGESAWQTILGIYADKQAPPRWEFKTPASNGQANPGPELPLPDLTQITIYPSQQDATGKRVNISVKTRSGSFQYTDQVQVFLLKPQADGKTVIIDQGSVDGSGGTELFDVAVNDTVLAASWDGKWIGTQRYQGKSFTLYMDTAPWQPVISAQPLIDSNGQQTGLNLTVMQVGQPSGPLQAILLPIGSRTSSVISLSPNGQGGYSGHFTFPVDQPVAEAHLWIRTTPTTGLQQQAITTYALNGDPTSHGRSYAPGSNDGYFSVQLPTGAVPAGTPLTVIPTRGLPQSNQQLKFVTPAYHLGAPPSLTTFAKNANLSIFYNRSAIRGVAFDDIHIYRWDGAAWALQGGSTRDFDAFIATTINQPGIYAAAAEPPAVVQLFATNGEQAKVFNVVTPPLPSATPITQVLTLCNGKFEAIYTLAAAGATSSLPKYIVVAPPYVNDLQEITPGQTYYIKVSEQCLLQNPTSVQSADHNTTIPVPALTISATQIPATYYGIIKREGANLPVGVPFVAQVGEKQFVGRSLLHNGESVYTVDVPADDPTTEELEGAKPGEPVQFIIDGVVADQSSVWQPGDLREANLTVARPKYRLFLPLANK